jgi:hypothetical protein
MKAVNIVTTMRLEDLTSCTDGTMNCKFSFFATIDGPVNLVRLLAGFQTESIYVDGC